MEGVAQILNVSEEEKWLLLSSGNQSIFDNREGWACVYLKKASLLETPRRGVMNITERGLLVLAQKPECIDIKFLRQFPELVEVQTPKRENNETIIVESTVDWWFWAVSFFTGTQNVPRYLE